MQLAECKTVNFNSMTKELKLGSDSEAQNALTSSQGRNKGLNTLGSTLLQHVYCDKWKSFVKVFVSMTELFRHYMSHKFKLIWFYAMQGQYSIVETKTFTKTPSTQEAII